MGPVIEHVRDFWSRKFSNTEQAAYWLCVDATGLPFSVPMRNPVEALQHAAQTPGAYTIPVGHLRRTGSKVTLCGGKPTTQDTNAREWIVAALFNRRWPVCTKCAEIAQAEEDKKLSEMNYNAANEPGAQGHNV